jgi:hypothetical protein
MPVKLTPKGAGRMNPAGKRAGLVRHHSNGVIVGITRSCRARAGLGGKQNRVSRSAFMIVDAMRAAQALLLARSTC